MDSRLLEILCCPITRRPLRVLDGASLERVNAAIRQGRITNHGGAVISEPLSGALVTTEGDLIYPVCDDIPVLLEEECIHWAAFKD